MDGVILTPLKKIPNANGDVLRAMKASDKGFVGFGEAYFSCLNQGATKGWKKHNKMMFFFLKQNFFFFFIYFVF